MTLRSVRWSYVIVLPAVLVIRDQDDRVLPEWSVAHRVDYLREKRLAALNVGGRMLIILELNAKHAKVGIHKRHRGQRICARSARRRREETLQRQEMRIVARTESAALRHVLKVVGPGNMVRVEQVEDGSSDRLVTTGRRKDFRSRQVAESGTRHKE